MSQNKAPRLAWKSWYDEEQQVRHREGIQRKNGKGGMRFLQSNGACGGKSPLTLLKAVLNKRLLCQSVEQTVLLYFSHPIPLPPLPLWITAFSKSPPDFQLLSLVAVPDKQNLLDQADFTAAPAHMAASVAHFLSSVPHPHPPLPLPPLCIKITFLQNPVESSASIIHQVMLWLYLSFAPWRKHTETPDSIKLD